MIRNLVKIHEKTKENYNLYWENLKKIACGALNAEKHSIEEFRLKNLGIFKSLKKHWKTQSQEIVYTLDSTIRIVIFSGLMAHSNTRRKSFIWQEFDGDRNCIVQVFQETIILALCKVAKQVQNFQVCTLGSMTILSLRERR